MDKFKVGTTVKLKPGSGHCCPEGRQNNRIAKIRCTLPSYGPGAVALDRDLHGCAYWNTDELLVHKQTASGK